MPDDPGRPSLPVRGVLLHDTLWLRPSADRRREWEVALRELAEEAGIAIREATGLQEEATLKLAMLEDVVELRAQVGPDSRVAARLALETIRSQVQEYLSIVDRMGKAMSDGTTHRLEALDLAKAIVHDDAATKIQRVLSPSIALDFSAARRLFTLLCILIRDGAPKTPADPDAL